jgi:hypothetical protein
MKNTDLYRLLVEINRTLQNQAEMQQATISALESLTKSMLQTVSSINTLNTELKSDGEVTIDPGGTRPSGAVH